MMESSILSSLCRMRPDLSSFFSSPDDGAVRCYFAWGLLPLGVEKDGEFPKTCLECNGTQGVMTHNG